ncbi:14-3-3 protein [Hypomontagnella monticulosa]|nr:14-3-3 protein [Hypomontagnella monticulosa]
MASSEVDQKFLSRFAKLVEPNNNLLSKMLYKILGLSTILSGQLVKARKQRRLDPTRMTESLNMYLRIIWLTREGLVMLEQYVLPMVGDYVELKVLAYKLRASFYHIFVLFHNNPPVSTLGFASEAPNMPAMPSALFETSPLRVDKGKGVDRGDGFNSPHLSRSSVQPTHPIEQGMSPLPPPGFEDLGLGTPITPPPSQADFLVPSVDFIPTAHQYFRHACTLADTLLWDSHSLRLSIKTEYAAFLYECVHDREGSRKLAKDTITEVYESNEGMDDDMFNDACELVTVLGKMMKRGLGAGSSRSGGRPSPSVTQASQGGESSATVVPPIPPFGMENPI